MNKTVEELEKEIMDTFHKGGPFAHNIIGCLLMSMSKKDKDKADEIHKKLCDMGY